MNHTERHHRAASSSDWNWRASPPWTKKLFGSWPSGSETRRDVHALLPEPAGKRLRRLLAAAVGVGIKGQIDGSADRRTVAETGAH